MSFADLLDLIGTAVNAPEMKWSEKANNGNNTVNTLNYQYARGNNPYAWTSPSYVTNQTSGTSGTAREYTGTNTQSGNSSSGLNTNPTKDNNNNNNNNNNNGIDPVALAEQARRNRINAAKAQAGNLRSEAQNTFNDILKAVNAFRGRSKTQFENAGQEIINTASNILGSNARTATEAAGEARARGRALGLGDSSKFALQNKVQGNLASTQGNTIAKRGEEDRANQLLLQERNDQAQNQEDTANTYLKSARDRATAIENAGYDTGEEVFSNALNDIVNYQRSLAALRGNSVNADTLSQYAPNFSGITNTINGVLAGLTGGNQGGTVSDAGNLANPVDIMNLLKRPKSSAIAY